jgi:hypothetical protein
MLCVLALIAVYRGLRQSSLPLAFPTAKSPAKNEYTTISLMAIYPFL